MRSHIVNIDKHVLGLGVMTCVFDADTIYILFVGIACVREDDSVGDKLLVLFAISLIHVSGVNEVG